MKTEINTELFRSAITAVNTLKQSNQLPVLVYAKLSINKGTAKLTTTDEVHGGY